MITHSNIIVLVIIVYNAINFVILKVAKIPSNPIVGSIKNGTGENIFNAIAKSGFFRKCAIKSAEIKSRTENIPPNKKNKLVILFIKLLACRSFTRGKKYEYAFGKPSVKTVSKVL